MVRQQFRRGLTARRAPLPARDSFCCFNASGVVFKKQISGRDIFCLQNGFPGYKRYSGINDSVKTCAPLVKTDHIPIAERTADGNTVHRMRILLADDNTALRGTAREIIEENPRWRICGEASDGRSAVELARRLRPDVIVLDYKMPIMNGLQAAQLIGSFSPGSAMILFTAEVTKTLLEQARASGVRSVVCKTGHGYLELLSVLERVSSETQVRDQDQRIGKAGHRARSATTSHSRLR